MTDGKRHFPFGAVALALLAIAAGGAGWCLQARMRAAWTAETRCEGLRAEAVRLAEVWPAPTAETGGRLEAELASARERLVDLRVELGGAGSAEEGTGAEAAESRAAGYFELAGFVERMRARAARAGVALPEGEYFGFASHAHESPPPSLAASVRRQWRATEFLVGGLIDAGARRIVAVHRERPRAGPATEGAEPLSRERGEARDFFEPEVRSSLRVPGLVETTALRIAFVGDTAALRTWLNGLRMFERVLVVREVEAVPAEESRKQERGPGAAESESVPLVSRNETRFTVTIEVIERLEADREA